MIAILVLSQFSQEYGEVWKNNVYLPHAQNWKKEKHDVVTVEYVIASALGQYHMNRSLWVTLVLDHILTLRCQFQSVVNEGANLSQKLQDQTVKESVQIKLYPAQARHQKKTLFAWQWKIKMQDSALWLKFCY